MSGKTPDELQFDQPDETITYLYHLFFDIKRSKGHKITYSELESYCSLMGVTLVSWEIAVIIKIDNIFESSL